MCFLCSMLQHDLFAPPARPEPTRNRATARTAARALDMAAILDLLTQTCTRPRYNFMILNLIAEASDGTGSAGPHVRDGKRLIPIRDWLTDAMMPVARRDPRRLALAERVRAELERSGAIPADRAAADALIDAEVRLRLRKSGKTNISRAVSELVRAGLLKRHYQGYRVDHHNRGAQRQAVYTLTDDARRALLHPRA